MLTNQHIIEQMFKILLQMVKTQWRLLRDAEKQLNDLFRNCSS